MYMNYLVCRFEGSTFVDSGADIPNADPEVDIQNVTETFDHSIRSVVTSITFHVMVIITNVSPGESINANAKKIMILQNIEAVSRMNVKYLGHSNTNNECTWSYINLEMIRNRILSEYRAWCQGKTSQYFITLNKLASILSQND